LKRVLPAASILSSVLMGGESSENRERKQSHILLEGKDTLRRVVGVSVEGKGTLLGKTGFYFTVFWQNVGTQRICQGRGSQTGWGGVTTGQDFLTDKETLITKGDPNLKDTHVSSSRRGMVQFMCGLEFDRERAQQQREGRHIEIWGDSRSSERKIAQRQDDPAKDDVVKGLKKF